MASTTEPRQDEHRQFEDISNGKEKDYACIECGNPTDSLFKKYSPTVLKLQVCMRCNKIKDKYIEYDQSIVFMDLVLQKLGAYRHVLGHGKPQSFWKFGFVCLLCDAYTTWTQLSCHDNHSCANVEWDFYIICALAVFELAIKVAIICLATSTIARTRKFRFLLNLVGVATMVSGRLIAIVNCVHWMKLSCGLMIANYGQLFAIPALVWDQRQNWVYLFLAIYVYFSHVQAYRAACSVTSVTTSVVIVAAGFLTSRCFAWAVTPASLILLRSYIWGQNSPL